MPETVSPTIKRNGRITKFKPYALSSNLGKKQLWKQKHRIVNNNNDNFFFIFYPCAPVRAST